MPPAAPLIAIAASIAIKALELGVIATIVLTTVVNIAVGFLANALQPKPPRPNLPDLSGFATRSQQRTQQVRQAITAWRYVYGGLRLSGPITFIQSTNDNKFLHIVVTLACHSCKGAWAYQLNEDVIYPDELDGDGLANAGKYDGKARFQLDTGSSGQPFSDLVSEASDWTNDHKQSGHTKVYARLEFDRDLFPSQVPNISVWLRGKSDVADIRESPTENIYTVNPALCLRDYMLTSETEGGLGANSDEVNDTFVSSAANTSEEFVSTEAIDHTVSAVNAGSGSPNEDSSLELSGDRLKFQDGDRVQVTTTGSLPSGIAASTNYFVIVVKHRSNDDNSLEIQLAASYDDALAGTAIDISGSGSGTHTVSKNAEPRYTLNGIVETDRQPRDVITDMLSAMGADMPYVGGAWNMIAAAFTTPTITLDEDDLRGPITIQTRVSRKERFNAVKGVYASPLNDGVPTDYPPVTNSTYQSNDGGRRVFRDLDLPMTSRPHTAQRLAKIALEKMRQEITASMPCKLTAFQVQAGDYVKVDNDRMGWAEKVFFVEESTFAEDRDDEDNPYLGIDLKLRESASAVFDWNSGEETAVDPAPNTNLPNPFTVGSPTGLVVTTEFVNGEPRIVLSWTPPADAYVVQDGDFQVTFRRANGLSLSFDGSDDHVTFNSAIDFDSAGSPGSEFAVECNVNWDGATGADQTIWTNGQLRLFRRNSDSKVVATLFSAGSPTVTASAVSTAALSANAWTHVAATWDGGTLRLLVDGTEDDTAAFSDTLASVVGPDMGRGDGVTRDTAYWSGRIDDFRVWDRRRTQTQISSNRTAALQGNETGLILYWPMDMASEQFVIDRTSVGNFGTLEGPSYDEGTITPNWEPSFSVDGSEAQAFIAPVEDGVPYDMRVRSRNHVGAVSSWSSLFGYTVGSPAEGATSIDDEGLFSEPEDRPSEDEGAFTQTVTQVEDEGAFV